MKNLLIGINAKYIHPNLGIRLLKKNTTYNVDIIEFTIHDKLEIIIDYILKNDYQTVGFSCYIWNISLIKEIISILRDKNIIIILGGPEVSYNANYYLSNNMCDYIIGNEGEEAYHLLLSYLDNKIPITGVPNLYYKDSYTFSKLVDIKSIKMAYDLLDDVKNKIIYLEFSRGCPYLCSYCLASTDRLVRFFDIEEIKNQIFFLLEKGAKSFKFLDRTFNINKKYFLEIIEFIIKNKKENTTFQFEITGDILDNETINYLNKAPKDLFRFEIGIQSTNNLTNEAIRRKQNTKKLFSNVKALKNITLHLDLIAGLPLEDYSSFMNTFNETISLRPEELQLGFLKVLKGTYLDEEKEKYGYLFADIPPYEIIKNDYLSQEELKQIKYVEASIDKYYNCPHLHQTINRILDNVANPFEFFRLLGIYYTANKKSQLHDLYKILDDFLLANYQDYDNIHLELIYTYLNYHKIKPKAWWVNPLNAKEKNDILRELVSKNEIDLSLNTLYKYAMIVVYKKSIIVACYLPNRQIVKTYNLISI